MVKQKEDGLNSQLTLVIKSGKFSLGFKNTMRAIRNGKAKAIVLCSNLPLLRKAQLQYLCMVGKIKIIEYNGTNTDLGSACGKLFRLSCLSINEAGDSDILQEKKSKRGN